MLLGFSGDVLEGGECLLRTRISSFNNNIHGLSELDSIPVSCVIAI